MSSPSPIKDLWILFFKIYLFMFEEHAYREEKQREVLYFLVYSPNGWNRQRWAGLKTGARSFLCLPHGYLGPTTWAIFHCFPGPSAEAGS